MARTKKSTPSEPQWESPTGMTYSADEVLKIRTARDNIAEAFRWEDTKEGDDYWSTVFERLAHIADEIERRIRDGHDSRL
jgi:hypothetical protein